MILLTGGTGRVGSAAAKALARANIPFRALVRDPDKVAFDPDVAEIVQGDLNDPAIVEQALRGVSGALIVMGNHPDQAKLERQFASLAADAGVSHLVKVSSMEAALDATATLPKNHSDTEQHIASLGLYWTFLRPNYYMQNMLMYAGSIARTNSFALPLGTAKTAMIDSRDVGEVAAVVLTGEGHAGQAYRLTGPAIMDFHEVAARMGTVLERPVSYLAQSPEAFRECWGSLFNRCGSSTPCVNSLPRSPRRPSKNSTRPLPISWVALRWIWKPSRVNSRVLLRPLASNHRCLQCG